MLVVFFSALIILVRLGRPTISALIMIAVWTLVTTLGALQSGVTSYFPALLIIPICVAGLLINQRTRRDGLVIDRIRADPCFTPNGDGHDDTAGISFRIQGPDRVNLGPSGPPRRGDGSPPAPEGAAEK